MSDDKKRPTSPTRPRHSQDPDSWKDLSTVVKVSGTVKVSSKKRAPISSVPPKRILPSSPPASPTGTQIEGIRLFVVDDDPIRVDALAMDLRSLGAIVAVGDRSQGGYNQAAKFLPDAIISDLVKPGELGFSFIQNLRRHPLLRWSSVVLLRWWTEISEDEGQVMLQPVLEQLEEVLAPIRIIEERIAAGGQLKERIEMTGPAALLRLISRAELSGELAANDAWNKFTIQVVRGNILSAYRKGIDGESDDDVDALLQLLLCDSGRWSFRRNNATTKQRTLDTKGVVTRVNRMLSKLFGPSHHTDEELYRHLSMRSDFLRTGAALLPDLPPTLLEAISRGEDRDYFRNAIRGKQALAEAERTVQTLFRSGVIRYSESGDVDVPEAMIAPVESIAALLKVMGEMPFAVEPRHQPGGLEPERADPGVYQRRDIPPESLGVPKRPKPMRLVAASRTPSPAAPPDEARGNPGDDRPSATDILSKPPGFGHPRIPTGAAARTGTEKLLMESRELSLGKRPDATPLSTDTEPNHMWVAILMALVLGGLLFIGVYFIASSGKEGRDAPADVSK